MLERLLVLEIIVLKGAVPGALTTVRSKSGEWTAVWMGDGNAEATSPYEVELEIDSIESWIDEADLGTFSGIKTYGGSTVVCGKISALYDDGMIALDLNPGTVMIEPDLSPRLQLGWHVCVVPASIEIFPTGI
ncbi:hypothetical protein ACIP5Y_42475 [Nocardia sp. NPDC088792]|uniref:hypothetical protein n=1 Tax=Nocardia sp. NPDC088792 TaxID=3364332 RepID=UPI00381C5285